MLFFEAQKLISQLFWQVAGYLQELVTKSGLKLSLGLVQTAYANGSSTKFVTEMMVSFLLFFLDVCDFFLVYQLNVQF